MSKRQPKFPAIISCAVPQPIADGLEAMASDTMLNVSDHIRMALAGYLRSAGVLAAPNGRTAQFQHQEAAHG